VNPDYEACDAVMEVMTAGMIVSDWPVGDTYRTELNSFTVHTPDGRALSIVVEDVTG
jgi:hypothetical protein